METKTNYTAVGLAVLILSGALLAAALWLSVGFDQKQYHTYAVYIREAASGLSEQSPVKYNGVKVGFVNRIELNQHDPQQVEILLSIEEGTPITISTSATLISQGITGTTCVGLSASSSDLTPLQKAPGEPYPVIPSSPSLFHQLDSVLKDVSENVHKVSQQIGRVFDEKNAANLKETLANVKEFTSAFSQNSEAINRSLKSSDILLHNLADASHQLPELIAELKTGVHKLQDMATAVAAAGQTATSTLATGKAAIDKMSQQALPAALRLIHRFDNMAANLEKVSVQMRQNPAVIIRGTTPPPPGPGE